MFIISPGYTLLCLWGDDVKSPDMDNQNEKMFETFLRNPANMHITFNDNHWKYRCSYICSCELSFPRPFANLSLDNSSLGCSQLLELLGCQTIPSPLPKPHFAWRLRLCLVNVKHVSKWLSSILCFAAWWALITISLDEMRHFTVFFSSTTCCYHCLLLVSFYLPLPRESRRGCASHK